MLVNLGNETVQQRTNPTIYLGSLAVRQGLLTCYKAIEVSIEGEKLVCVVQGAKELAAYLLDSLGVELDVIPRGSIGNHIPAEGV